jgi:hypothetical protein
VAIFKGKQIDDIRDPGTAFQSNRKVEARSLATNISFLDWKRACAQKPFVGGQYLASGDIQTPCDVASVVRYWAVRELRESTASIARRFNISPVAAGRTTRRGAEIAKKKSLN